MSKPREFWLVARKDMPIPDVVTAVTKESVVKGYVCDNEVAIHTIEYSAYLALQKENERLSTVIKENTGDLSYSDLMESSKVNSFRIKGLRDELTALKARLAEANEVIESVYACGVPSPECGQCGKIIRAYLAKKGGT